MAVNNYIRIGYPPELTILTFDDKNSADVERVKLKVTELLGGRTYNVNIGLWARCFGLPYPLIGEAKRGSS